MAGSQKRIAKELADLTTSPLPGVDVSLVNESSLYQWKVQMKGPEDSPYEAGIFTIDLVLPTQYPFKPPTLSFRTKVYHPNITNDDKGSMCLGMLKSDEWKPSSKISAVLEFARQLLKEPMPDDAIEGRIAEQYKNDPRSFEKEAREYVKRYAMGSEDEKKKLGKK